jgi:hypothetical protein
VPYLTMLLILIVAFYTVLFGIENWKEKNYRGFLGITLLALTIVLLPFYLIFLRK